MTKKQHDLHIRRSLRIRTVAELVENGWRNPSPHYDAALVCPSCQCTLEKIQIVPRSGESQTEAARRVLYNDGGFEKVCPDCEAELFRNTAVVHDYFTAKEGYGDPSFPYTVNDLPIELEGYDPGPHAAAVLMRYFHTQADFATEAEDVPWGLDVHLVRQCPLCTTTDCELDFHHWKYSPDIGVALCRECHTTIHEDMRAREQSSISWSGEWEDRALALLVRRHRLSRGLPGADAGFWEIKHRYNIPFSTERIESAYNRRYGDCDHEYIRPPNCEHCGEVVVNLGEMGT